MVHAGIMLVLAPGGIRQVRSKKEKDDQNEISVRPLFRKGETYKKEKKG